MYNLDYAKWIFRNFNCKYISIFSISYILELFFSLKEYNDKPPLLYCSSECAQIRESYWKNYFQFLLYCYYYFFKVYDKNN